MGSTKSKAKRVASFDVFKVKQVRTFKPVNKRAKAYAKALGVKVLTVKQVREIKLLGKHKVVVYESPLSNVFHVVKV